MLRIWISVSIAPLYRELVKRLKQSDAYSMPAERILVFRSRSRSYLGGIFLPSNFSGAPPRASASTNEDGGRVVASAARRLRP